MDFVARFNALWGQVSDNYVLKRQSLKLLSEFLLERENFDIMMRYIGDAGNLMEVMRCLRSPQANIQYEAFHVLKVFVANPEKKEDILRLLKQNKAKLCAFLRGFQNEKDEGALWAFLGLSSPCPAARARRLTPPSRFLCRPAADKQFMEEKQILIESLEALPDAVEEGGGA